MQECNYTEVGQTVILLCRSNNDESVRSPYVACNSDCENERSGKSNLHYGINISSIGFSPRLSFLFFISPKSTLRLVVFSLIKFVISSWITRALSLHLD